MADLVEQLKPILRAHWIKMVKESWADTYPEDIAEDIIAIIRPAVLEEAAQWHDARSSEAAKTASEWRDRSDREAVAYERQFAHISACHRDSATAIRAMKWEAPEKNKTPKYACSCFSCNWTGFRDLAEGPCPSCGNKHVATAIHAMKWKGND